MSDLRPCGTKIKLGKNEYGLRFTLNAIDDIQDHFDIPIDGIAALLDNSKTKIKSLRYILALLINEGIDCEADETGVKGKHLDELYVGRHIDLSNVSNLVSCIYKSIGDGVPVEDDANPNVESGQQKS